MTKLVIIDDWMMLIVTWIVYVHVYGVSLSLYRNGERKKTFWKRMKNLKIGIAFWGTCYGVVSLVNQIYSDCQNEVVEAGIVGATLLIYHGIFFCAAKEKKIRTSLWLWVVIFTMMMPISILNAISFTAGRAILERKDNIENFILDIVLIVLGGFIYWLDKRTNFAKRVQKKEKNLLVIIIFFITFSGIIAFSREVEFKNIGMIWILIPYLVLSAFALIMVIRVIAVGTEADRYEELSAMHEKNAKETLAFYESYKEAQMETRKLRHDMRNHFFCIQMLAKEGKYKEMERYLENFNEAIEDISMEFQTGNDIVDAILNVKCKTAKKVGIQIKVEGDVPFMPHVAAMDWCKIFSNALDNALEAVEQCEQKQKWIQVQLKSNQHFFMIRIENPCETRVAIEGNVVKTTKKEKQAHGFGLKNMEAALKKYNGELKLKYEEREGEKIFLVDMLFPIKD